MKHNSQFRTHPTPYKINYNPIPRFLQISIVCQTIQPIYIISCMYYVFLYLNLFALVFGCVCASMCVYFCLCVYVYVCVNLSMCVCACMWVHVCPYAFVCLCVCVGLFVSMCLCVLVCPYVSMCVCESM
jgi:hypothetical protein